MKHNLPYLINLPPFILKDMDQSKLVGVRKIFVILFGKLIGFLIKKTNKKLFCFFINLFFKRDGKISYENEKYIKLNIKNIKTYFPNKRVLRMVKNSEGHLNRIFKSYCLDMISIDTGDIVVDCGANIGELNLALQSKNIEVNYYAFEPDQDTFECLKLNHPRCKNLYNYALSDSEGNTKLYIDNEGGNSSLIEFGSMEIKKVQSIKLDSLNFKENIKLLKIEAEGFEPEVLKGSLETLGITKYLTIDYGAERGHEQEMTLVDCNKVLYENNFELIGFSDYRLIGLYKNKEF